MSKALVVTVFTVDISRADELEDLTRQFGAVLSSRGISSIVTLEAVNLPETAPASTSKSTADRTAN